MTSKPLASRRKWKRFKVKDRAFVMLHRPRLIKLGKPRLVKSGPIVDISMGGLAVQYIENRERLRDYSELSIIIPPDHIKVEEIPFKVLTDIEIAELPDSRKIRNRCLKFGKLTPYQEFQLESFIKNHGFELLKDRRSVADRRKFNDSRFFDDEDYRVLYEKRVRERRMFTR